MAILIGHLDVSSDSLLITGRQGANHALNFLLPGRRSAQKLPNSAGRWRAFRCRDLPFPRTTNSVFIFAPVASIFMGNTHRCSNSLISEPGIGLPGVGLGE